MISFVAWKSVVWYFHFNMKLRADTVCVHFVFGNIVARQMHVTSMNCANGCLCVVSAVLIATKLSNVSLQIEMQTLERNKKPKQNKTKTGACVSQVFANIFLFEHLLYVKVLHFLSFHFMFEHRSYRSFRFAKSAFKFRISYTKIWLAHALRLSLFGIRHSASTMWILKCSFFIVQITECVNNNWLAAGYRSYSFACTLYSVHTDTTT